MFKKAMITGIGALVSINAHAYEDVFGQEAPLVWSSIITLSGGPAWSSPGQSQYRYPLLPFPQTTYYTPISDSPTMTAGEIFFGLQRIIFPGITGELGIGLAGSRYARLLGVVAVNGVPNVSTYEYQVVHGRAEFKGKLIANAYRIQPYASGSLGAGWNNSHDYRATTIDPVNFPAPWFASQTTISFAYTLGLGIQTLITPHWQVGVGYEFADWGKARLGLDAGSLIPGPSLTHLYSNQLLFSLSCLF